MKSFILFFMISLMGVVSFTTENIYAETKVQSPKNSFLNSKKSSPSKSGDDGEKLNSHQNGFGKNVYVSDVDQDLAIKSIVLLPVMDNVGTIYSKPIETELRNVLNSDKQWSLSVLPKDFELNQDLLEENPQEVKKILKAANAEAALQCTLVKGSRGISVVMNLYVGHEGLPFLQESFSEFKGFEINDVKSQVTKLFENLRGRMPFRGNILSRRGQEVTLNLGSDYGLKEDSRVSVVQILKMNRHPKLKFLVSTEKEVLGRVKLFKVEPYFSFGFIEFEKEPGVISVGAKVMPDEFVKYAVPVVTPYGKVLQDLTQRPDKEISFGEDPKEWNTEALPQFGKIEVLGGLSVYAQNLKLTTAGSFSANNSMAPNILVRGEVWINPELFINLGIRQSIFLAENGLTGSSPTNLTMTMGQYNLGVGYNFLLTDQFFGPKMALSAGYSSTEFSPDSSTPLSLTRMNYGGFLLGIAGIFPVSDELPLDLGAKLDIYLSSSLTENKKSGESSSHKIGSYSFFADYRLRKRFKLRGEVLFENYNSDFNGVGERLDPAVSISHSMTSLMAGVQFLF